MHKSSSKTVLLEKTSVPKVLTLRLKSIIPEKIVDSFLKEMNERFEKKISSIDVNNVLAQAQDKENTMLYLALKVALHVCKEMINESESVLEPHDILAVRKILNEQNELEVVTSATLASSTEASVEEVTSELNVVTSATLVSTEASVEGVPNNGREDEQEEKEQ
ncbi:hypothetical protein ABK040_002271 [Willaertia magna]